MPNSRFALHGLAPPQLTVCAVASNSRFMHLSQAALDTCLGNPFFANLSVDGLHFTVYAPSSCHSSGLGSRVAKKSWKTPMGA